MFPFLKTKLFLFLVLAAVGATFYYFGDPQKLAATILPKLKTTPLAPAVEKLENLDSKKISEDFQNTIQNTEAEISTLSEKTAEASKHTGNVLGSSVKAATSEEATPIHEKAFEYGKYIYCKQVVTDYEKLNPSLSE
ncbi:hypothetical protein KA017_03830 [Candidatus Woesebacteria bacterium]|nr:hypothetical protein [Candidatus Woesebacteria bacterium]